MGWENNTPEVTARYPAAFSETAIRRALAEDALPTDAVDTPIPRRLAAVAAIHQDFESSLTTPRTAPRLEDYLQDIRLTVVPVVAVAPESRATPLVFALVALAAAALAANAWLTPLFG